MAKQTSKKAGSKPASKKITKKPTAKKALPKKPAAKKTTAKKVAAKKPAAKATVKKTTKAPPKPEQKKKPQIFSDKISYAPLNLFEYPDPPPAGRYCLLLSDGDMVDVMDLFEEAGQEGGGHSWGSICKHLIKTKAPTIAKKIETDPEAGTFVAFGKDLAALQQLATLLHQAFHDRALLASLIKSIPKSKWD